MIIFLKLINYLIYQKNNIFLFFIINKKYILLLLILRLIETLITYILAFVQ